MTVNQWTTTGRPMSRIAQRFWGGVGQRILDSGALDGTQYKPGQTADEGARLGEYDRRHAYYLNDNLYGRLHAAGLAAADMPAEWNPIPAVVGFYASTALPADLPIQPTTDSADAEKLTAAVERLRQWSNWQTLRRDLVVTAAVLQDVFLKVAERAPSPEVGPLGVYMQDIPPQNVRWWDADERGFLTGIRIDTPRLESVFTGEAYRHTLVEVWRKAWPDGFPGGVRYYELKPGVMLDNLPLEGAVRVQTFDELGYDFIPIVWARVDTHWRRQVAQIDRYNEIAWVLARLNRAIALAGAGGVDKDGRPLPAPLGVADGLQAVYSDTADGVLGVVNLPGASTMAWSGPPIDFAAMGLRLSEIREGVIDGLPEYRVATLRGIQIASETLQLLLNQAEARALEMRAELARALVRAHMMAFTIAQVAGVAPDVFGESVIGTFDDGRTEHEFVERPVFPKTAAAKAAEALQHTQNGVGIEAAYRLAGFTEEEATMAMRGDEVTGIEQ